MLGVATVTHRRETYWVVASVLAAILFCAVNNDYGYDPWPYFAVGFYLVAWVLRKITSFAVKHLGSGAEEEG